MRYSFENLKQFECKPTARSEVVWTTKIFNNTCKYLSIVANLYAA